MVAIYTLDVPEFESVVRTGLAAGMTARLVGDYIELSSTEPEVVLWRRNTGIRTAIWFAALTGGLSGRIVSFDEDELRIAEVDR